MAEILQFCPDEETGFNIAIITGSLVRDPYYSESKDKGKRQLYASFTVKVKRAFKEDIFDYIRVRVFGYKALFVKQTLFEGMNVEVKGKIRPYKYETEDKKVYTLGVYVQENGEINILDPGYERLEFSEERYKPVIIPQWMIDEMPFK